MRAMRTSRSLAALALGWTWLVGGPRTGAVIQLLLGSNRRHPSGGALNALRPLNIRADFDL